MYTLTTSTTTHMLAAPASSIGHYRHYHVAWTAHGPSRSGLMLPAVTRRCTGTLQTTRRPLSTSTTYRSRRSTHGPCDAAAWRPAPETTARQHGPMTPAKILSPSAKCLVIELCRGLARSTAFWSVMRLISGSCSSRGATRDR